MTALPAAGFFTKTDPRPTNAQAKQAQDDMLEAIREAMGGTADSELTIASGSVTATRFGHSIDTESDGAADDLTHIAQTNMPSGRVIAIRGQDAARVVTVKHAATGDGEIVLANGADLVLSSVYTLLVLQRRGAAWVEMWRWYGADMAAFRSFLGLADAAKLGTAQAFTKPQRNQAVATNATTTGEQTPDWANYADFDWTLTGDFSIANGTIAAATVGQRGRFRLIQDGTGGRALTALGTNFKRVGGTGIPTLPAAAAAVAYLDYEIVSTSLVRYAYSAQE